MIYRIKKGQVSMGEPVGILLLDTSVPFIPGDVANATTYDFPVRFKMVEGFSVERAIGQDPTIYDNVLTAAEELIAQGVRGITGDCGFMGAFQNRLAADVDVPVFMSSLLQIDLILRMIGGKNKVGIITADSRQMGDALLDEMGVRDKNRLAIAGLQDKKEFYDFAINETGVLDTEVVQAEIVQTAVDLVESDSSIKAILLECSLLPPHAAAVQRAVNLPVFDFITLINYAFTGIQKTEYTGYV